MTGQALDTIFYVTYHQYWEKVNKELQVWCQYDLHYRLENFQYSTPVSNTSVGMHRLRENNRWKEEDDFERYTEEDSEPYHGLTLQWIVPEFCPAFHAKPGQNNFRCGLDETYREDSDWESDVIVTESKNSWYSYGVGRTAGFLRREIQWSSVDMTLTTITYIKAVKKESDFEVQIKDMHVFLLIVKLRQLPTTLQDIKALFDVWDYHTYMPRHYIA